MARWPFLTVCQPRTLQLANVGETILCDWGSLVNKGNATHNIFKGKQDVMNFNIIKMFDLFVIVICYYKIFYKTNAHRL